MVLMCLSLAASYIFTSSGRIKTFMRTKRGYLYSPGVRISYLFLQLLWSFCCSQLTEAETKPFRLTQAIPGASKTLDYDSKLSFEESGLANSMISVTWE